MREAASGDVGYPLAMAINAEIAELFDRMAAALELLGENRFRAIAYSKAARALTEISDDVAVLACEPPRLLQIGGIGKDLASQICEYVETGHIARVEKILTEIPPGVLELVRIPGVGPKTAASLWKDGGVTSVADLKAKLETDELESMPRMGAKTLEKLKKAIAFAESGGQRVRIGDALPVAEFFIGELRKLPAVKRIDYCGSLRRGVETIGDIDILVGCDTPANDAQEIAETFSKLSAVREVLAAGATKSSIRTAAGMQVDLRIVNTSEYGAALMYFTGSKQHNVVLRQRAIDMDMKLNEYGLWPAGAPEERAAAVAADTEANIYQKLRLQFIPPEMREDRGEVDVADQGELPRLVEIGDIRCDLHAHTTASDGVWTIDQWAEFGKARGYHTVAVTDHSVSQYQARGLNVERMLRQIEDVREARKRVSGINILVGTEVDILADGSLDYPDEVLAQLDVVVASPHAALTQEGKPATARLIRAIENPYVHIIGHPTGRLVLRRPGIDPDMQAVIKAAAATGTALEINANYHRLDLRDTHAKAAIEAGVKLAINTDAHAPSDVDHLMYGILTARRAWARAEDVVNCLDAEALKTWLKAKRTHMGRES